MKIEMGESLMVSWLRHVKGCQIVQTNWTVSPTWSCVNMSSLSTILALIRQHFLTNFGYTLFGSSSMSQIICQGESDVIGIDYQNAQHFYAIDIAFHKNGLGYGSSLTNVQKITEKCLRTAMCIYGYFGNVDADIIFATPKMSTGTFKLANTWVQALNTCLKINGLNSNVKIIANQNFCNLIVCPVMSISKVVNDTNELFLRSYQLLMMCCKCNCTHTSVNTNAYGAYKVGQLANNVLRDKLETGNYSQKEIEDLQDKEACKALFGINYPLLVPQGSQFDLERYYITPLIISQREFYLCSQWYEKDRESLIKWIDSH